MNSKLVQKYPHLNQNLSSGIKEAFRSIVGNENEFIRSFCFLHNRHSLVFVKSIPDSKSVLIYIIGQHRDFHWVIDCFSKRFDYDFIEFNLKTHEQDKSIENIKIESITDNLDDYTREKIKESTSNIFGQRSVELNENLSKYLNFKSPDANESTKTDLFEEYFYPEYFLNFF